MGVPGAREAKLKRKPVSLAACAIMAAALIQAPTQAIAVQNPIPPGFAATNRPLATGQLLDNAGKGVPADGPLVMFAWPSNKVLDKMGLGETVKLVPISQATTDNSGNFSFRSVDAAAAARYTVPGEPLNVTIDASRGNARYSYSTSVDPAVAVAGTPKALQVAKTPADMTAADTGKLSIKPMSVDNSKAEKSAKFDNGGYADKFCGGTYDKTIGKVAALVGSTMNYAPGASARYTFTSGANATLGVGVSSNAAFGSWDAGGTTSVTSSYSVGYASNKAGTKLHWTYVQMKRWRRDCWTNQGGVHYLTDYTVRPTAFLGGGATNSGSPFTSLAHCVRLGKGITQTQNRTTAITWSNGLKLGSKIGVNLTSRSGFTSTSSVRYYAGSYSRRLCGQYADPGAAGPRNLKITR